MNQQPLITMTPAAIEHVKRILAQHDDGIGFRIDIKQTGCTGYMYVPEIVNHEIKEDHKEIIGDLTVYITNKCVDVIKGTKIDYVQKDLGMSQLDFDNPNVDSLCGCGESFNLKESTNE